MSFPARCTGFLAVTIGCLMLTGCSGCNRTTTDQPDKATKKDDIALAQELYRAAKEAPQFRGANDLANRHLANNSDLLLRHYPGAKDRDSGIKERAKLQRLLAKRGISDAAKLDDSALYKKFLKVVVGLDAAEIDEVENPAFTLLDAHYLEGCHFLREAERAMRLPTRSPLEQAEFCFHWAMRQIVLQEGRKDLLPPQLALRRGQGSSAERAFTVLAMVQQLTPPPGASAARLDGCVIAFPAKDGQIRPWLVGVLISTKERADVYLFDPRLGLPVPGRQGKGIATLAQLRADPTLLDGFKAPGEIGKYDVDAKQVAQAEIALALPLSGLSARMRYLQDELLLGVDQTNIALRAADLVERFENLDAGPVRVWNAPAPKAGVYLPSPTRALRLLLPPAEGGIDSGKRWLEFKAELTPWAAILKGYADQKLSYAELGIEAAQQQLRELGQQLWLSYGFVPTQELLRGRLKESAKRLVRMQRLLEEVRNRNVDEAAIAAWRQRVRDAFNNPTKFEEIWIEDQWLLQLLAEPDEDPPNPRVVPRKLLSDIVLRAVNEPVHSKGNYLLALRWQEEAERLRAQQGKQEDSEAWSNANHWWHKYEDDNPLTVAAVQGRFQAVKEYLKGNRVEMVTGLLEYYGRLLREATAARLLHARALRQAGKLEEARATLKELVHDLTALEKEAEVQQPQWSAIVNATPPPLRENMRAAVDGAVPDFGSTGSLFWLRYAARLQLALLRQG